MQRYLFTFTVRLPECHGIGNPLAWGVMLTFERLAVNFEGFYQVKMQFLLSSGEG